MYLKYSSKNNRFLENLLTKIIIQYFYRIYPTSVTVPHRTAPKRYFSKMPLHLNVTFLTHRNMQRYIEKYAVTSIVTLNCSGKYNVTVIIVTAC